MFHAQCPTQDIPTSVHLQSSPVFRPADFPGPVGALHSALYRSPFSALPTAELAQQTPTATPGGSAGQLAHSPPGPLSLPLAQQSRIPQDGEILDPVTKINTVLCVGSLREIRQWVKVNCILPHILWAWLGLYAPRGIKCWRNLVISWTDNGETCRRRQSKGTATERWQCNSVGQWFNKEKKGKKRSSLPYLNKASELLLAEITPMSWASYWYE